MIFFANAKINLGLQVLRKREDNYHEISSLMYPIPYTDVLEILPSEQFDFEVVGKEIEGDIESNLVVKAYRLMEAKYEFPCVRIILQKNIAMGAGLGGGSSDASFVLKSLNEMFELGATDTELKEMAAQLGSDCPFFIENTPQIASGTGTTLSSFDLDLKGMYLHLVCPSVHVSTQDAYAGIVPENKAFDYSTLKSIDFNFWRKNLCNDFEKSVFAKFPELKEIKNRFIENGAEYASMSGSGSSIFGLYRNKPEAWGNLDFEQRIFQL